MMQSLPTPSGSYPSPQSVAATPPRTSATILIAVAAIVLATLALATVLVLALNKRAVTDPKVQAQRFFNAAKIRDWKALYTLSEAAASNFPTEAAYESKMREMLKEPFSAIIYEGMLVRPEISVGTPVIAGEKATIPITRHEMAAGKPLVMTTDLKMHKSDGVWRVANANGYGTMVAGSFDFTLDSRTATPVGGTGWRKVSAGEQGEESAPVRGGGFVRVPINMPGGRGAYAMPPPQPPVAGQEPASAPAEPATPSGGMDFGNRRPSPSPVNPAPQPMPGSNGSEAPANGSGNSAGSTGADNASAPPANPSSGDGEPR